MPFLSILLPGERISHRTENFKTVVYSIQTCKGSVKQHRSGILLKFRTQKDETAPPLLTGILTAELSLRSKRFRASSPRKAGTTAKKKRNDGGGGGESRKRLPANSTILKNFLFSPPPPTSTLCFFRCRSNFRAVTRLETVATQAKRNLALTVIFQSNDTRK